MNGIIGGVFLLTVIPGLWAPIEHYIGKLRKR